MDWSRSIPENAAQFMRCGFSRLIHRQQAEAEAEFVIFKRTIPGSGCMLAGVVASGDRQPVGVVGTDGLHRKVREAVGVAFTGYDDSLHWGLSMCVLAIGRMPAF